MTIQITLSKTLNGAQVSDSLQAGGTGYQFGSSEAGQPATTQNLYLRHNGTNKIYNLSVYAKQYSQTYGGEYSASADHAKLIEQGDLGSGVQVDFDWDAVTPFTSYSTLNASQGTSVDNAIEMPTQSMFRYNGGSPVAPSAPVLGELGASGDTSLGDTALLRARWVVPANEQQPGRRQVDLAFRYNFTT